MRINRFENQVLGPSENPNVLLSRSVVATGGTDIFLSRLHVNFNAAYTALHTPLTSQRLRAKPSLAHGRDPFGLALALGAIPWLCSVFRSEHSSRGNDHNDSDAASGIGEFYSWYAQGRRFSRWSGELVVVCSLWEYSVLAVPAVCLFAFSAYPQAMVRSVVLFGNYCSTPPFAWSHWRLTPSRQKPFSSQRPSFMPSRKFFTWFVPSFAFEWWVFFVSADWRFLPFDGAFLPGHGNRFAERDTLFLGADYADRVYGTGEHRSMVQALYRSPSQFLRLKVSQGFLLRLCCAADPPVMPGMVHYILRNLPSVSATLFWASAVIPCVGGGFLSSIVYSRVVCVVAKYAFYVEGMSFMFVVSSMVTLTLANTLAPIYFDYRFIGEFFHSDT